MCFKNSSMFHRIRSKQLRLGKNNYKHTLIKKKKIEKELLFHLGL